MNRVDYALVRNIVYSTHPRHLATDIPIDTRIQIVLRYDLDSIGFKSEHVILQHVEEQRIIPIEAVYDKKQIKVTPLESLAYDGHYILELIGGRDGVKTITNAELEESFYLEFYTGHNKEVPTPILTSPANQTAVKEKPTFTWAADKDMFYYHLQVSESNTFNHIVWPADSEQNVFDGQVTPDYPYKHKRYYARIKAVNILNKESAWSETIQFVYEEEEELSPVDNQIQDPSYKIESNSKVTGTEIDALQEALGGGSIETSTRVAIKGVSVAHGSYNLPLDSLTEIHVQFADKIDPKTINSKSIYLIGEQN